MKKIYIFIALALLSIILYSGCKKNIVNYDQLFEKCFEQINIQDEIKEDINLPTMIDEVSIIWSSSHPNIITSDGKVNLPDEVTKVTLFGVLRCGNETKTYEYEVKVLSKSDVLMPEINEAIEYVKKNIPSIVQNNYKLPLSYQDVEIKWYVNNVLINDGTLTCEDYSKLTLEGRYSINNFSYNDYLEVVVLSDDLQGKFTKAKEEVSKLIESSDLTTLPNNYEGILINYEYNSENINSDGSVIYDDEEHEVLIRVKYSYNDITMSEELTLIIPALNDEIIVKQAIKKLQMPQEVSTNLVLIQKIDDVDITWRSGSKFYVTDSGIISRSDRDLKASLIASFTYGTYKEEVTYKFIILKYSDKELIELVIKDVIIPSSTNMDISLPLYLDYDVEVCWQSSNESILSNDGKVTIDDSDHIITLKAIFTLNEEKIMKEYSVKILKRPDMTKEKPHQKLVFASDFTTSGMNEVSLQNDKLVLNQNAIEGTYVSEQIDTMEFSDLVASWAAVSGLNSTVELELKVLVNDTWSDYITYHEWGRGRNNKCFNQTKSLIKLVEDEVSVLGSGVASAIMFKLTLRRTSASDPTPEVQLVSFALENSSYSYPVDITDLPKEVKYDVPRLNQNIVPTIGNIICSATTSTMLLKYKGEDFSSFDTYEHRYIAGIVREYNSGIYGNWVYNTVAMGSYGYISYVARMYSVDELIYHLANFGPVGLSVKGQMTSNEKNYYTNGHLIVCVGYRFENGNLTILCNDPNVTSVYCEYSLSVIKNTWRNIAYVII